MRGRFADFSAGGGIRGETDGCIGFSINSILLVLHRNIEASKQELTESSFASQPESQLSDYG
jgi:hypothetical protein